MIAIVFKDQRISGKDLEKLKKAFNVALQKELNPLFRVLTLICNFLFNKLPV